MKSFFSSFSRFFVFLFFVLIGLIFAQNIFAQCQKGCNKNSQKTNEYLMCVAEEKQCWEERITETRKEANTLTNAINILNGQISLQQLQVNQTLAEIDQLETEIEGLSQRIEGLGYSLDRLGSVLIQRVRAQYKQARVSPALHLLGSKTLGEMMADVKYLLSAQRQTVEVMEKTETQRLEYDEQKNEKEKKQTELESKRNLLVSQRQELEGKRASQRQLLEETKNSERAYQEGLNRTLEEHKAIQAIILGQGVESEAGSVSKGQRIASVIEGKSCNSSGTHLHFMVRQGNTAVNPFNFLKPGISFRNCSADTCDASYSDPFNPSGSWDWPIKETIMFTQGYGSTWAIGKYASIRSIYSFHNGIDINSTSSLEVASVAEGTLFRGSYGGSGGCRLPYVRVQHKEGNISTFYLHVNY